MLALKIDRPLPGVALVAGVASLVLAVDAITLLNAPTFARVRRTVLGGLRELLVLTMLVGAIDQACVELWCVNRRIKVAPASSRWRRSRTSSASSRGGGSCSRPTP